MVADVLVNKDVYKSMSSLFAAIVPITPPGSCENSTPYSEYDSEDTIASVRKYIQTAM